jgi:hypothetical protein
MILGSHGHVASCLAEVRIERHVKCRFGGGDRPGPKSPKPRDLTVIHVGEECRVILEYCEMSFPLHDGRVLGNL